MKITGTITKILETQSGTSSSGKDWKKTSFLLTTTEEYNNLYCFEIFGDEKVDNFLKFNKLNSQVEVDFNVKTNEWKDKYYVSLDAWKIFSVKAENSPTAPVQNLNEEEPEDLPF